MPKKYLLLLILLFLLPNLNLTAGEVYKTKQKNGDFVYTNVKPKNEAATVVEVKKYRDNDQTVIPDYEKYPENEEDRLAEEKQNYIDDIFREKAEDLSQREESLKKDIVSTKDYIDYLEDIIEDFLVNGYFADNYIFELRVQERNLEIFKEELEEIKQEEKALKKEARKNNVDPGILRVK